MLFSSKNRERAPVVARLRITGMMDHAGDGFPVHSAYGNALTAAKPSAVAHPLYCTPRAKAVGGTMGALSTQAANAAALYAQKGYFGDAPQGLQGTVKASSPWLRR